MANKLAFNLTIDGATVPIFHTYKFATKDRLRRRYWFSRSSEHVPEGTPRELDSSFDVRRIVAPWVTSAFMFAAPDTAEGWRLMITTEMRLFAAFAQLAIDAGDVDGSTADGSNLLDV